MQDEFGGIWTETKIEIMYKYAEAYLYIMNKQKFHLTYFDGFAGGDQNYEEVAATIGLNGTEITLFPSSAY